MTGNGGGALLLPRENTQICSSEWGLTLPIIWFTVTAAANAELADCNLTTGKYGAVPQLFRLVCVRLKEQELCKWAALQEGHDSDTIACFMLRK